MGKAEGERRAHSVRCVCCKKSFKPNPRLGQRQKTCGDSKCRLFQRARYRRRYRDDNSEAEAGYRNKQKEFREPGFWKAYRETHPESTERNRANSRLRKKLKKAGLQRQLDIAQLVDPPGNLEAVVEFATSHQSLLRKCLSKKCG